MTSPMAITQEIRYEILGIHGRCGGQVVLLVGKNMSGYRHCLACGVQGPLAVLEDEVSDLYILDDITAVDVSPSEV